MAAAMAAALNEAEGKAPTVGMGPHTLESYNLAHF